MMPQAAPEAPPVIVLAPVNTFTSPLPWAKMPLEPAPTPVTAAAIRVPTVPTFTVPVPFGMKASMPLPASPLISVAGALTSTVTLSAPDAEVESAWMPVLPSTLPLSSTVVVLADDMKMPNAAGSIVPVLTRLAEPTVFTPLIPASAPVSAKMLPELVMLSVEAEAELARMPSTSMPLPAPAAPILPLLTMVS